MAESTNANEQCMACKVIGVSALFCSGLYVIFNAKHCQKQISKNIMKCIGGSAIGLGLLRAFDLYPCQHTFCN